MGKLSTTFKKEEVFYLTREVRNLIKLLEDINTIDENKLNNIEKQKNKLDTLLYKYEPTIYDEYSQKAKFAYIQMIKARKEYDRVVSEKCYKEVIEQRRLEYENLALEYERIKDYRNKLKSALECI